MQLKYLFTYRATVDKPIKTGQSPKGTRTILPITSGEIEGDNIKGKVLPVGAEFLLVDGEGQFNVDVRAVFETDDGAHIYTEYTGVFLQDDHYKKIASEQGFTEFGDAHFVTTPRFETGHEKYQWLNRAVCVAEGRVAGPASVEYRVYQAVPSV